MKKQLISLMLVLIIIPSVFLFSGCKEKGYQLKNLQSDYQDMVSGCDNIKCVDNKIVFDYSNFYIGTNQFMNAVIEVEPYNQIENYNILFDNLMGFVYEYIGVCSSNNVKASVEVRDNLKTELDSLGITLKSMDVYISQWAEMIKFNYNDDYLNIQCLSSYKNLLYAYNELYQKAITFSNSIADLYYNYALNDSNPRIDNLTVAEFNSSVVIAKLQGRVKYQISNLSQLFVEKYIDGLNIENSITTYVDEEFGKLNLTENNYISKVNSLQRAFGDNFDAESAVIIANGESKKQTFYNCSIKAYNLQNILDNDNYMFVSACNKIQYGKADSEDRNKNIIDNYDYIVQQYNTVLISMLDCIGL